MKHTATCSECGFVFSPEESKACPACGRRFEAVTIRLSPITLPLGVAPLTTIQSSNDSSGTNIVVKGPAGHSEATLDSEGVRLEVTGKLQPGTAGEGRVLDTLVTALRNEGRHVTFDNSEDHRGEDGALQLDGQRFVVQTVTVPIAEPFWREASKDSARTNVPVASAAEWFKLAIEKKAQRISPADRGQMILSLDIRNVGVLASASVVREYIDRHGPPSQAYGFASVWLVGPTLAYCTRLGVGKL